LEVAPARFFLSGFFFVSRIYLYPWGVRICPGLSVEGPQLVMVKLNR
jgi:hypothetical protein